jgi:hypothetical protein
MAPLNATLRIVIPHTARHSLHDSDTQPDGGHKSAFFLFWKVGHIGYNAWITPHKNREVSHSTIFLFETHTYNFLLSIDTSF